MKVKKVLEPFPHLIIEELIDSKVYSSLKFPKLVKRENTRAGWDLFKGELGYDEFFESDPNWKLVRELLDSPNFIKFVLSQFKEELENIDIDISDLKFVDYIEKPYETNLPKINFSNKFDKRVFSRFDLQASDGTTLRKPHVDNMRRFVGGVLFFCDGNEEGIEGGEFGIWEDLKYKDDRKIHSPKLVKTYPIKHNTMYIFLNTNNSFHGPSAITSIKGFRKWSYFSVSAFQNIFTPKSSFFKKLFLEIKYLLLYLGVSLKRDFRDSNAHQDQKK